ncbi:MAG: SprT family zinc-dependent metalloprotease [Bacteroidota bacterium]|jgi:hypothetical protein
MEPIEIHSLVRTNRKTLSIIIDKEGNLIVRAPLRLHQKDILHFVEKNSKWINKKKEEQKIKQKDSIQKSFSEGTKILFLGKEQTLKITSDTKYAVHRNKTDLILHSKYSVVARSIVIQWFYSNAKNIIPQRVQLYTDKIGSIPNRIRITGAVRRWGSCSSKKNLNFSWRLIMAPIEVIDYVVVHELCHFLQMNHSKKFWRLVESIIPEYKEYRKWLRVNEHLLDL